MPTLVKNGIIITDTDLLVLQHDLLDPEDWVLKAVIGKVAACKKRLLRQWVPKLIEDPAVTQMPGEEAALIAMIVARPDYRNRVRREAETAT